MDVETTNEMSGNSPSRALAVISDNPDHLSAMTSHLRSQSFQTQGFPDLEALIDNLVWSPGIDCLIINLPLDTMDGANLFTVLRSIGADIPLVLVVRPFETYLAVRTFNAGVIEVIEEPVQLPSLTAIVKKAVTRGTTHLNCRTQIRRAKADLCRLTTRQKEIVALVTNGLTSKEIGIQLGISYRTVEAHRLRIMERLGARSQHDVIKMQILADLDIY